MKLADFQGYEIHLPDGSGSACKGQAVTSSIQVRKGLLICKQFRFLVSSAESLRGAMRKAKAYILTAPEEGAQR